jgi:hypothetical protein
MPVAAPGGRLTWTKIDAEDADRLRHRSWWLHPDGYAASDVTTFDGRSIAYLHREVVTAPPDRLVDHINGDRLDNRKANLRLATHSQNAANSRDRPRRSGYRGVYPHKPTGRWIAQISIGGHVRHLGIYDDPQHAAMAYDHAARAQWGPFARTNGFA